MAVTKLNYVPGVSETITGESLDDTPVLNTWYPFAIDDWKLALADVVLSQAGTPVPTSAYELATDTEYTAREATESGDTIYAAWRITNATYAGIATTVSAENYGSYVDNEAVRDYIDTLAVDADQITYDNAASGLTATDVQTAIDEVADDFYLKYTETGSETVEINTAGVANGTTLYFTVSAVDTTHPTNPLLSKVQITLTNANSGSQVNAYISSSISGAESGSTSWGNVARSFFTLSTKSSTIFLPPGQYALYITSTDSTTTVTVKYKKLYSNITY